VRCRLQTAISAVSQEGVSSQQASKLLKPLMTAVDMVFGSAAALSATFGSKVPPHTPRVYISNAGGSCPPFEVRCCRGDVFGSAAVLFAAFGSEKPSILCPTHVKLQRHVEEHELADLIRECLTLFRPLQFPHPPPHGLLPTIPNLFPTAFSPAAPPPLSPTNSFTQPNHTSPSTILLKIITQIYSRFPQNDIPFPLPLPPPPSPQHEAGVNRVKLPSPPSLRLMACTHCRKLWVLTWSC